MTGKYLGASPMVTRGLPRAAVTKDLAFYVEKRFDALVSVTDLQASRLFAAGILSAINGERLPVVMMIKAVANATAVGGAINPPGSQTTYDVATAAMISAGQTRLGGITLTHPEVGHGSMDPCVGTAWCVGQHAAAGWPAIIGAFGAGFEAQLRLTQALQRTEYGATWDLNTMTSVIGATCTAALLLGLRGEGLAQALGIASSQTVGAPVLSDSDAAVLHGAKPAANAVMSAFLAQSGFTASSEVLEVHRGLFPVVALEVPQKADVRLDAPEVTLMDAVQHSGLNFCSKAERPCGFSASQQRLMDQISGQSHGEMLRDTIRELIEEADL